MADVDEVLRTFILGWDRGKYHIQTQTLAKIAAQFPYTGSVFRGGGHVKPPTVSWSRSIPQLLGYWSYVGIPDRSIAAFKATVSQALDVAAVGAFVAQHTSGDLRRRAQRLHSFGEVVSLNVPPMIRIGTLVEDRGGGVTLVSIGDEDEDEDMPTRVVARFLRRADLEPPLGYPGGPCHVVERIEKEVQNPALQEKLVEEVEHGEKVQNPDASKIYTLDREHGVGPITQLQISPHAQYRMDLRGVTVPLVRVAIRSLMKTLNDWKSRKNPMYERVTEDMARGQNYEWVDPTTGLAIVVRPGGPSALTLVTTYWKGESDPRAPGACT